MGRRVTPDAPISKSFPSVPAPSYPAAKSEKLTIPESRSVPRVARRCSSSYLIFGATNAIFTASSPGRRVDVVEDSGDEGGTAHEGLDGLRNRGGCCIADEDVAGLARRRANTIRVPHATQRPEPSHCGAERDRRPRGHRGDNRLPALRLDLQVPR